MATCSRGQAVALTVFVFSSIFFTSLAIAFVRPFSLDEAISKVSPSYIDHCEEVPGLHSGKNTTFRRFSHLTYVSNRVALACDLMLFNWDFRFEHR